MFSLKKPREEKDNDAHHAKDRREDPEPHRNLRFRQTERLKMVVDGRREKHFLAEEFSREKLDDDGRRFHNKHEGDDRQKKDGICQKCNDRERDGEPHNPRLPHVKLCRMHIEP